MLIAGQCTPRFSFVVPKEKRAVHGPKRKALARSGAVALRATGVGGSVQAPIWAGLWAHHGFLRFPDCRPVADGADLIGVVVVLASSSVHCCWTGSCGSGIWGLLTEGEGTMKLEQKWYSAARGTPVSYTHLRAHET